MDILNVFINVNPSFILAYFSCKIMLCTFSSSKQNTNFRPSESLGHLCQYPKAHKANGHKPDIILFICIEDESKRIKFTQSLRLIIYSLAHTFTISFLPVLF